MRFHWNLSPGDSPFVHRFGMSSMLSWVNRAQSDKTVCTCEKSNKMWNTINIGMCRCPAPSATIPTRCLSSFLAYKSNISEAYTITRCANVRNIFQTKRTHFPNSSPSALLPSRFARAMPHIRTGSVKAFKIISVSKICIFICMNNLCERTHQNDVDDIHLAGLVRADTTSSVM